MPFFFFRMLLFSAVVRSQWQKVLLGSNWCLEGWREDLSLKEMINKWNKSCHSTPHHQPELRAPELDAEPSCLTQAWSKEHWEAATMTKSSAWCYPGTGGWHPALAPEELGALEARSPRLWEALQPHKAGTKEQALLAKQSAYPTGHRSATSWNQCEDCDSWEQIQLCLTTSRKYWQRTGSLHCPAAPLWID